MSGSIFNSCQTSDIISPTLVPDEGNRLVVENAVVSSAHPLASEVGKKIMEQGGNAVDSAVAVAFALGVVEPHMSGLGGGGSMLIWHEEPKVADYVDFYPAKRAETYKNLDYDQIDKEFNLLSVAIPGMVAGLLETLERHGTMSRQQVIEPAIQLAKKGFPVYKTMVDRIEINEKKLKRYEGTRLTYWPGGESLELGETLRLPEMAETLRMISDQGRSVFYEGEIAWNIVDVLNAGGNPVSLEDFTEYEPQWNKRPICSSYKGYTVLSAPPPQTGIMLINALNLLENYDLKEIGYPTQSAKAFDIITSAMRVNTADRRKFISDPNWKTVPVEGMSSKAYADVRRDLVGIGNALEEIGHGDPYRYMDYEVTAGCESFELYSSQDPENLLAGHSQIDYTDHNESPNRDKDYPLLVKDGNNDPGGETTHFSVVDPQGNAVSFSGTLSPSFGSGAWVDGFVLNDSGFNFENMGEEEWEEGLHPYRIRSSTISPTILLKDGKVHLVIGAPGGGHIPTGILQAILYTTEYGLDAFEALSMPRIFPSLNNHQVQIEQGFSSLVQSKINEMGYDIQPYGDSFARIYLILRRADGWSGAADPRHGGAVKGF